MRVSVGRAHNCSTQLTLYITNAHSPSISAPQRLPPVTSSGCLHLGMSMTKSTGEPIGTNWLNAFILFVNLSEDMIFWPFLLPHLTPSRYFPPPVAGTHSHIHTCNTHQISMAEVRSSNLRPVRIDGEQLLSLLLVYVLVCCVSILVSGTLLAHDSILGEGKLYYVHLIYHE